MSYIDEVGTDAYLHTHVAFPHQHNLLLRYWQHQYGLGYVHYVARAGRRLPVKRKGSQVENATRVGDSVSLLLTEDAVARRWYLTVPEVAAHTGLSAELVRKAIYAGELRATRFHRRWLMTADDVRAWIAEHGETNVA